MSYLDQFTLLDRKATADGRPYDQYILRRTKENADAIYRWGLINLSHTFHSSAGPSDTATAGRPVCSATGWSTVLVTPFWVPPELNSLRFTHDVRVAHGPNPKAIDFSPRGVLIRYELLSDPARAIQEEILPLPADLDFLWDRVVHDLDVSEWAGSAPRWDLLSISMKSQLETGIIDPSAWGQGGVPELDVPDSVVVEGGVTRVHPIEESRRTQRAFTLDLDPDEGDPDGSDAYEVRTIDQPDAYANETTATVLIESDDRTQDAWEPYDIQVVDHLYAEDRSGTGDFLQYWPPFPALSAGQVPDPDVPREDRIYWRWAAKVWVSYAQWRSITVEAQMTPPERPRLSEIAARAPAAASALRRIRTATAEAIRRPKILCMGTPGFWPQTEGQIWGDKAYAMRHGFVQGGADGAVATLKDFCHAGMVAPYAQGRRRVRLWVAPMYHRGSPDEDSWSDALDRGVSGIIEVNGVERRMEFCPTGNSPASKLRTVTGALSPNSYASSSTVRLIYQEGRLHFGPGGTDYDVGEVLDVEWPWESEAIEIGLADEPDLQWVDTADGLPEDDDGEPVPEACLVMVLAYCVYCEG